MTALSYQDFLEAKKPIPRTHGIAIAHEDIHEACRTGAHQFQAPIIQRAALAGVHGLFINFGLGKTFMELELCRLIIDRVGGWALIVAPLGVRPDFFEDAAVLGIPLTFAKSTAELNRTGVNLTNYESVRDGKIDLTGCTVASLDEGSVLRGLGTKTFREFYRNFPHVPFKFVATATPAPNDYIEILNYAMFLGVMDIGEAKTRFFRRDSEHADTLTLHLHKVDEFWAWASTWGVYLQKPSDLGFSDEGFELPPIQVNWHVVGIDHSTAGSERDGQHRLLHDAALGLVEAAAAKRQSMPERLAKVAELVSAKPTEHVIIWHDLEDERRAIERSIENVVTVYGSQDLDEREASIIDFAYGRIQRIAAKPVMFGSGCNLQRHCHWAIYAGVGFKFNDFIQSLHRLQRFLQLHDVTVDIVFAESEAEIVKTLKRKWRQHDEMMARMSELIRQYGLSSSKPIEALSRSIGATRREASGRGWTCVNNDAVEETRSMATGSVKLLGTSVPFSTQYEYTPSYNDFGHTDDKAHFLRQMDYLSPELYRVLEPGRVLAVHVKDRVRPGGYDNRSFQSIDFFHCDIVAHYLSHGFVGMGMITVITDVVRENAGTYRLGWSMQCEDGSRMGVGLPEYILLFRKPPTDSTRGYADVPVVKTKAEYTKGRWQIEAHAFWKSNGNRFLTPADFVGLPWNEVFQKFRNWTTATPYDHERVVAIAEAMDAAAQLPPDFMLLQPGVDHPDVWCDVMRARGLNTAQSAAGREKHLCPLPFDIVDRLITRFSNPGDLVYDPFGGLGTFGVRALKLGRHGRVCELNPAYHDDSVRYHRAEEESINVPTLFDLLTALDDQETAA